MLTLTGAELPSVFTAADQASLRAQRDAVRWRCAQLSLLLVAGLAGVLSMEVDGLDAAASLGGLAFAGALICELARAAESPEREWYRGRAGAESVKTLSWKFSVAGRPFGVEVPDAEDHFVTSLEGVTRALGDVDWSGTDEDMPRQVTEPMLRLRLSPLEVRQEVYLRARIADQRRWYGAKAAAARRRSRRWSMTITAATAFGIVAAVSQTFGDVRLDFLGFCASAAAAATAWTQFRQYDALASAYGVAARELLLVEERLVRCADEQTWARLVEEAETAISREHTLWAAKRDVRIPA